MLAACAIIFRPIPQSWAANEGLSNELTNKYKSALWPELYLLRLGGTPFLSRLGLLQAAFQFGNARAQFLQLSDGFGRSFFRGPRYKIFHRLQRRQGCGLYIA